MFSFVASFKIINEEKQWHFVGLPTDTSSVNIYIILDIDHEESIEDALCVTIIVCV